MFCIMAFCMKEKKLTEKKYHCSTKVCLQAGTFCLNHIVCFIRIGKGFCVFRRARWMLRIPGTYIDTPLVVQMNGSLG